jgi:hypothetical protein
MADLVERVPAIPHLTAWPLLMRPDGRRKWQGGSLALAK